MKDERKTAPPPAKRQKPNIRTEGSSELARHKSPPSASREKESPIPPVPPKKKLPTIKKNKDALSAAPATPSIAARAQLQTTTADVDLSNSSIYSELFNKAVSALALIDLLKQYQLLSSLAARPHVLA